MIYILAYIIIYILSTWRFWLCTRMAYYHPQGKGYESDPDSGDYWLTFCPVINTGFCVVTLFSTWKSWKRKHYKNDNIFKPKKPLT